MPSEDTKILEFCQYQNHLLFRRIVKKKVTNGEEVTKNISYVLQIIDSTRFMASSLSNPVNNLSEGIHRITCNYRHDDKKCETRGIKCKYCDYVLEYTNFKDDLKEYKCFCCNKKF